MLVVPSTLIYNRHNPDFFRSIHDHASSLRCDRLKQWLARQQEKIHARAAVSKDGQFVTSGGFQTRCMVDQNGFAGNPQGSLTNLFRHGFEGCGGECALPSAFGLDADMKHAHVTHNRSVRFLVLIASCQCNRFTSAIVVIGCDWSLVLTGKF
jgi:hypothetical protein